MKQVFTIKDNPAMEELINKSINRISDQLYTTWKDWVYDGGYVGSLNDFTNELGDKTLSFDLGFGDDVDVEFEDGTIFITDSDGTDEGEFEFDAEALYQSVYQLT